MKEYESNEILHFIYTGEVGFNDKNHLKNFVKYLFGSKASGRHVINEHTKNNVYTENIDDDDAYAFTTDPLQNYTDFMNKHFKKFYNYSAFRNDVFYVPFLLEINGGVVSNFLKKDEHGETYISFEYDGDGEAITEGVSSIYPDGTDGFISHVEKILAKHDEKFMDYSDCRGEERMKIERMIHKKGAEYINKEIILSISHDDQFENHPIYHLHRMYHV